MDRTLIRRVQRDIQRTTERLIARWERYGAYENFGDTEHRKLKDKYNYNPYGSDTERRIADMIDAFDQWAMHYTG